MSLTSNESSLSEMQNLAELLQRFEVPHNETKTQSISTLRKNRLPLRRLSTFERIELAREQYYVNIAIADRPSRFFVESAPVMSEAILRQAYKRVHEDRLLLALYESDEEFRKAVDAGEISPSAAKERARQLRRQSEEFQSKKSRAVAARHERATRKRFLPNRGLQHEIDLIYSTLCQSR